MRPPIYNSPFGRAAAAVPPLPGPKPVIIPPLPPEVWQARYKAMAATLRAEFIPPEELAVVAEDVALQWDALSPRQRISLAAAMTQCLERIKAILTTIPEEEVSHDE